MSSTSTSSLEEDWFNHNWHRLKAEWLEEETDQFAYEYEFNLFIHIKWGEYCYQKITQKIKNRFLFMD
jgi:hypothetical protein